MARTEAYLAALAALLVAPGAVAQPVRVAVYAPWAGPKDSAARFALSQKLAARIAEKTGLASEGQAFARFGDLDRALRDKRVDFALMDTGAAARDRRVRILSSWQTGRVWVLAMRRGEGKGFRGKTLGLQAADSETSRWFFEDVLLRGQAPLGRYFGSVVSVPVTHDAQKALELGKVDVVAAPLPLGGHLQKVMELGQFAECVTVVATPRFRGLEATIDATMQLVVVEELGGAWASGAPRLAGPVAAKAFVLARPRSLPKSAVTFESAAPIPWPELVPNDVWVPPEVRE